MQGVRTEMISFLSALLTGMTVACVYWCIRKFRRVIRHSLTAVAVEDALYWAGAAIYVFAQIYYAESGSIRWYFVVGTGAGVLVFLLFVRLAGKTLARRNGKRKKKSVKTIEIKGKKR